MGRLKEWFKDWLTYYYKPRKKIHNCKERGCAIEDHKFSSLTTGSGDKK
jgi:hypothetical protein